MNNNKIIQALYGLKWNPFLPEIPIESLWIPPGVEDFFFSVEDFVIDGGFTLICGDPGLGKSKILQLLAHRLQRLDDVVVGVMERPQSSLNDFYRELGELFGVNLSPANRYGGFKTLRERWKNHIKTTLFRPILIIDEAQEMIAPCLNEIRLLGSADFDSVCLLTTVICGDMRMPERFRSQSLMSLGTRIRLRMTLHAYPRNLLLEHLEHSLVQAGAPNLMTKSLKETLCDHCAGNLRLLNTMAAEMLNKAAKKELTQLDEKLYLETFSRQPTGRNLRIKKYES